MGFHVDTCIPAVRLGGCVHGSKHGGTSICFSREELRFDVLEVPRWGHWSKCNCQSLSRRLPLNCRLLTNRYICEELLRDLSVRRSLNVWNTRQLDSLPLAVIQPIPAFVCVWGPAFQGSLFLYGKSIIILSFQPTLPLPLLSLPARRKTGKFGRVDLYFFFFYILSLLPSCPFPFAVCSSVRARERRPVEIRLQTPGPSQNSPNHHHLLPSYSSPHTHIVFSQPRRPSTLAI